MTLVGRETRDKLMFGDYNVRLIYNVDYISIR